MRRHKPSPNLTAKQTARRDAQGLDKLKHYKPSSTSLLKFFKAFTKGIHSLLENS